MALKLLAKLAALAAVGTCAAKCLQSRQKTNQHSGFDEKESGRDVPNPVRNAGPDAMRTHTSQKWDSVDDASDASFPASDPPATY